MLIYFSIALEEKHTTRLGVYLSRVRIIARLPNIRSKELDNTPQVGLRSSYPPELLSSTMADMSSRFGHNFHVMAGWQRDVPPGGGGVGVPKAPVVLGHDASCAFHDSASVRFRSGNEAI